MATCIIVRQYTKVKQRNSYTVEFSEKKFGEILYYVVLDQSAYAFLCPFNETPTSFCKYDFDRKAGKTSHSGE